MKDKTLVIMAAGMGSRFGGLKQIEPVGPNGEFIIDYSIYDAIKAGFNKVVFIIKEENYEIFKKTIGDRINGHIAVDYVFQKLDNLPEGYSVPMNRVKPWGTSHAIMSCYLKVNEDFIVINADDFYGRDAFMVASKFLDDRAKNNWQEYAIIGYRAINTITENGAVKRGVCELDGIYLKNLIESELTLAKGTLQAVPLNGSKPFTVEPDTYISMNFFAFTKNIITYVKNNFAKFLAANKDNLEKCEYLLPDSVFAEIQEDSTKVRIVPTTAKWYGVTYKDDKEKVVNAIKEMIDKKEYPQNLWKE